MNTSLKALTGVKFGKITDGSVKVGLTGLAFVGKDGQLKVYNKDTKEITVAPADFSIGDFPLFIVPVTADSLKEGDIVIQNDRPKVYIGLDADGKNKILVNPVTEEYQTIVPSKSILGFNFVGKVVSVFGDAPLGNIVGGNDGTFNPQSLLMLSMLGDGDGLFGGDDEDGDNKLLPLLLMSGGLGNLFGGDTKNAGGMNPLMLMMLLGKL